MLIEEAVLRYRLGGAETMAGQLGHLLDAITLPSLALGVIPFSADERPMWTLETFTVFDDSRVHVELLSAQVTVTAPSESGSAPCTPATWTAEPTELPTTVRRIATTRRTHNAIDISISSASRSGRVHIDQCRPEPARSPARSHKRRGRREPLGQPRGSGTSSAFAAALSLFVSSPTSG
jgi:hypothetical protein